MATVFEWRKYFADKPLRDLDKLDTAITTMLKWEMIREELKYSGLRELQGVIREVSREMEQGLRTKKRVADNSVFYPNPEDWDQKFYSHDYLVGLTAQNIQFKVNAVCEGEALDWVIDCCEEHKWWGLVNDGTKDYTTEELEEYYQGGNHGLYLTTHHVHVTQLR